MNLIIGGTHGLGACIASDLRDAGQETFVTGRSYDEDVHGAGIRLDLNDEISVNELVRLIGHMNFASVYWLAGYGYVGDFAEQSDPDMMARINFANVLPILQAAWRTFLLNTSPTSLVIVSSTTGLKPRANEAVYAATKHAQVGFARSLGMESERLQSNVRVSLFMPGGMKTSFWDSDRPDIFDQFLDPQKVSRKILDSVISQKTRFYEEPIERGSL